MSESEAVWNAIKRNWDDEVWLEEVAGRFWRLTLQVNGRSTLLLRGEERADELARM